MSEVFRTEVAEVMSDAGKVYEIAEKTVRKAELSAEEKEASSVLDAWAKGIGEGRADKDHEISAFITRTVNEEIYNAPDELLDQIFDRGTVGEFDDTINFTTPKNTLVAYEAAKGGNVPRSYLNFKAVKPTYKNIQVETDLSLVDLRRNGWKNVALLTTYMGDALKNKMFAEVFGAIDAAIAGGEQVITATGNMPTIADMDALALYLNEHSDGATPVMVALTKYAAGIRRMDGFKDYLSDSMKNDFNRYGLVSLYDGIQVAAINSTHKLGDGTLPLPSSRIFGLAGKVGTLDMKGDIHTYQTEDYNNERIHLMMKDFTFGYAVTDLSKIAKITLA